MSDDGRSAVIRRLSAIVLPIALAACADGTLPAHSVTDPRDPRAVETPFAGIPSASAPAEGAVGEAPDAGHPQLHEGASANPDRPASSVATMAGDARSP
jgi:hypothetical protein